MFNVSIHEYFSVVDVFIVCIRNTAVFKLIPLLCTHVYSYMFRTVHPPSERIGVTISSLEIANIKHHDIITVVKWLGISRECTQLMLIISNVMEFGRHIPSPRA